MAGTGPPGPGTIGGGGPPGSGAGGPGGAGGKGAGAAGGAPVRGGTAADTCWFWAARFCCMIASGRVEPGCGWGGGEQAGPHRVDLSQRLARRDALQHELVVLQVGRRGIAERREVPARDGVVRTELDTRQRRAESIGDALGVVVDALREAVDGLREDVLARATGHVRSSSCPRAAACSGRSRSPAC